MVCSNCGQPGHNRRTCSGENAPSNSGSYADAYESRPHNSQNLTFRRAASPSPTRQCQSAGRTVTCSYCSSTGHNIRTCPQLNQTSLSGVVNAPRTRVRSKSPPPARTVSCSNCSSSGHNTRTCPQLTEFQSTIQSLLTPTVRPKSPSSRTVTCSNCSSPGHNTRTCPYSEPLESHFIPVTSTQQRTRSCSLCDSDDHEKWACSLLVESYYPPKDSPRTQPRSNSPPARTLTCSICSTPGHNSRTCPNSKPHERRMSPVELSQPRLRSCSLCDSNDHEKLACPLITESSPPKDSFIQELFQSTRSPLARTVTCSFCSIPGHNIRGCPELKASRSYTPSPSRSRVQSKSPPPRRTVTCSNCSNPGHNSRTCQRSSSTNDTIESKTRRCSLCESSQHNKLSCPLLEEEPPSHGTNPIETKRNDSPVPRVKTHYCGKCGQIGHNIRTCPTITDFNLELAITRTCSICRLPGHNIKTCPENKETKQPSLPPYGWLSESAQERLTKGPTLLNKLEGPGYIYIYRKTDESETDDSPIRYKIGRSKDLPQRRVKAQESKNGVEYTIVQSFETPFHHLTENVVHAYLKEIELWAPREDGDGKNEWFWGKVDFLKETVKNVIREVRDLYGNSPVAVA
jgi:hypothetical protein